MKDLEYLYRSWKLWKSFHRWKDGGQADAIEEGKTGYLCDGNDLNSIYETILKFFQNDQYKVLGLQAKEFSKKFKWENIVKQYLNLI